MVWLLVKSSHNTNHRQFVNNSIPAPSALSRGNMIDRAANGPSAKVLSCISASEFSSVRAQENRDSKAAFTIVMWCLVQCLFFTLPQWAQQTAIPSASGWGGIVRNASGQPVAGATVKISGQGGTRTSMTGLYGGFSFLGVVPGQYALAVQMPNQTTTAAL